MRNHNSWALFKVHKIFRRFVPEFFCTGRVGGGPTPPPSGGGRVAPSLPAHFIPWARQGGGLHTGGRCPIGPRRPDPAGGVADGAPAPALQCVRAGRAGRGGRGGGGRAPAGRAAAQPFVSLAPTPENDRLFREFHHRQAQRTVSRAGAGGSRVLLDGPWVDGSTLLPFRCAYHSMPRSWTHLPRVHPPGGGGWPPAALDA